TMLNGTADFEEVRKFRRDLVTDVYGTVIHIDATPSGYDPSKMTTKQLEQFYETLQMIAGQELKALPSNIEVDDIYYDKAPKEGEHEPSVERRNDVSGEEVG